MPLERQQNECTPVNGSQDLFSRSLVSCLLLRQRDRKKGEIAAISPVRSVRNRDSSCFRSIPIGVPGDIVFGKSELKAEHP